MAAAKKASPPKSDASPVSELVLREFVPIGKYRIRLVKNGRKADAKPTLDIREYVSAESFEGFTRRGIRLTGSVEAEILRDALKEVLEGKMLPDTSRKD